MHINSLEFLKQQLYDGMLEYDDGTPASTPQMV